MNLATKARIKWGCIILKSFCAAKEAIDKIKRQLLNGRKYLQIIGHGLISKIYKSYNLRAKNQTV